MRAFVRRAAYQLPIILIYPAPALAAVWIVSSTASLSRPKDRRAGQAIRNSLGFGF